MAGERSEEGKSRRDCREENHRTRENRGEHGQVGYVRPRRHWATWRSAGWLAAALRRGGESRKTEREREREGERQSRVRRTNGGIDTRSAMTRARAIPANRGIPSLYICTWRWRTRNRGSLLAVSGGFQRGNGECWRGRHVERGGRTTSGRGVGRPRPSAGIRGNIGHRLLGRARIAQTRPRWPVTVSAVSSCVVVVMEARSVPIDTPAAEYRPWRPPLSSSRVTRPEVNASRQVASRTPPPDRHRDGDGDDKKRGRDRVRGAWWWCESVAEAVASPQTRRALSPPLNPLRGNTPRPR